MKRYDVFISYSRKDKAFAQSVCQVFDAYKRYYKFEYFFDTSEIGIKNEYLERIADAISQSKSMLFLASKNSYSPGFCTKELLYAEEYGVAIYRYCLDKSKAPQKIELLLIDQHYLEYELCPIEEMVRQVLADALQQDIKPLSELQRVEDVVPNPKPSVKDRLKSWTNILAYLSVVLVALLFAIQTCTDNPKEELAPQPVKEEIAAKPAEEERAVQTAERKALTSMPLEEEVSVLETAVDKKSTSQTTEKKEPIPQIAAEKVTTPKTAVKEVHASKSSDKDNPVSHTEVLKVSSVPQSSKNNQSATKTTVAKSKKSASQYSEHKDVKKTTQTADNQSSTKTENKPVESYNIGDLVTVNGVQGIVFQISPVVKIVSVKEGEARWSAGYESTYAQDDDDGKTNMKKIQSISDWQTKYPAFKWCVDYGDGWYLPARNELQAIYNQREKINKILSANNMNKIGSENLFSWLWSSSGDSNNNAYADYVDFSSEKNSYSFYVNTVLAVRAVYVLD